MLAKQLAAGAAVVAANNDVELKPARAAVLCLLVGYPLRPQLRDLLLDVQRRGPARVRDGLPHLQKQLARRYPAAIHHAVTLLFALSRIVEGKMAGHAGGRQTRGELEVEEEAERKGGARDQHLAQADGGQIPHLQALRLCRSLPLVRSLLTTSFCHG